MATITGTWLFNEIIVDLPTLNENFFIGNDTSEFVSNNASYNSMRWTHSQPPDAEEIVFVYALQYYNQIEGEIVYPITEAYHTMDETWSNEAYRTIDFGTKHVSISDEFYAWLTENATRQVPVGYGIISLADYEAACDAIRAKTGKTDLIKSREMASEITSIPIGGGGASFNIHYGLSAPEDTSKLWIETDSAPEKVQILVGWKGEAHTLNSQVNTLSYNASRVAYSTVNNKIYMFGGSPTTGQAHGNSAISSYGLTAIRVYDPETNTIQTLTETCNRGSDKVAVSYGSKIYIFGNHLSPVNYGNYGTTTIYVFDTETSDYYSVSAKLPQPLGRMAAARVEDKIYVFGGYGYDHEPWSTSPIYNNKIFIYDITKNQVITLDQTGLALQYATAQAIGEKIYVFGGINSSNTLDTVGAYVLDTTDYSITELPPLPQKAQHISSVAVNNDIYLFGGRSSGAYLNTITVFHSLTNTYEVLDTSLTIARWGIISGLVGNKIYLLGGCNNEVQKIVDEFVITSALESEHLVIIPSMTENIVELLSGTNSMQIGIGSIYIGDQNHEAQRIKGYLYNNSDNEWQAI